jgi:hypothetical protein
MVVLAGDPAPADACGLPQCMPGHFVPRSNTTVPANIPAVYWQPLWDYQTVDIQKLRFSRSAGAPPKFTVSVDDSSVWLPSFSVFLDAPLAEGTTYTLADLHECEVDFYQPPSATFVAGPPAALPTTLGTLTSTGPTLATHRFACPDQTVEVVQQIVQLELSSDAAPWRDALHFRTLVDDSPWRYEYRLFTPPDFAGYARDSDLIYALCGPEGYMIGVSPGVHEVKMRATLPGTDLVLETPPITIELHCPPDPTLPDPPPPIDDGCATTSPSWGVLGALLLLLRRRRRYEPTDATATPASEHEHPRRSRSDADQAQDPRQPLADR